MAARSGRVGLTARAWPGLLAFFHAAVTTNRVLPRDGSSRRQAAFAMTSALTVLAVHSTLFRDLGDPHELLGTGRYRAFLAVVIRTAGVWDTPQRRVGGGLSASLVRKCVVFRGSPAPYTGCGGSLAVNAVDATPKSPGKAKARKRGMVMGSPITTAAPLNSAVGRPDHRWWRARPSQ